MRRYKQHNIYRPPLISQSIVAHKGELIFRKWTQWQEKSLNRKPEQGQLTIYSFYIRSELFNILRWKKNSAYQVSIRT